MTKLEELYAKRKVFEDYNSEVPVELQNEISREEHLLYENAIDNIASFIPEEIEKVAVNRIVFVAEYIGGKLKRFGTGNAELSADELFGAFKTVESDEQPQDSEGNSNVNDNGITRGPSIGFTVKFGDGKTIKHTTADSTMIESLRYMGLERASMYRGETFKGFPLIGKKKRITTPQRVWQKEVDGWWVYVNMSNPRKITCIKGVASMLNIPLEIVMGEKITDSKPADEFKGKRPLFSINGEEPACKNRTVWNVVNKLLNELPTATFKEISDFFPKTLQGSYGVVATIVDIEERNKRTQTERKHWFLDPAEILTSADGIRFAVSTEWGHNFVNLRTHVIREFGWTIDEV